MSRTHRRDPYRLEKGKIFRDGRITMASTPGWWVHEYMNMPKRRLNRDLCRRFKVGAEAEFLPWPTGNRKPQWYYW